MAYEYQILYIHVRERERERSHSRVKLVCWIAYLQEDVEKFCERLYDVGRKRGSAKIQEIPRKIWFQLRNFPIEMTFLLVRFLLGHSFPRFTFNITLEDVPGNQQGVAQNKWIQIYHVQSNKFISVWPQSQRRIQTCIQCISSMIVTGMHSWKLGRSTPIIAQGKIILRPYRVHFTQVGVKDKSKSIDVGWLSIQRGMGVQ